MQVFFYRIIEICSPTILSRGVVACQILLETQMLLGT